MTRIDDDRLLFYIEHAQQIRQWAALGDEVRDAANEFLTRMLQRFENRDDLPPEPVARGGGVGGNYPHVVLYLDSWRDEEGTPLVRVAISWSKRTVGLDPRTAPYVGVTTNPTTKLGKLRSTQLRSALESHRHARGATATDWWPSRRRVAPQIVDGHIDLSRYEDDLITELRREWEATKTTISGLLDG